MDAETVEIDVGTAEDEIHDAEIVWVILGEI